MAASCGLGSFEGKLRTMAMRNISHSLMASQALKFARTKGKNSYRSLIHAARLRSRRLLKPGSVKRLAKAPLEFEWRTFRLFRRPARRRHENPYGRGMVSVLLSHLVEIEFDKCSIWLLMNVTH